MQLCILEAHTWSDLWNAYDKVLRAVSNCRRRARARNSAGPDHAITLGALTGQRM